MKIANSLNDSRNNRIVYLSAVEILFIHDRIIEKIGGINGIRDENLLQSITMRPRAAFGGNELFVSVFEKVAAYLEGIAALHPFSDGNKRTSISVASAFLYKNGYGIELPIEESEQVIIAIAQKKRELPEIAKWLEKHANLM